MGAMSVAGVPVKINLYTELTHSRDPFEDPLSEDLDSEWVKIGDSPAAQLQIGGGFTTAEAGVPVVTSAIVIAGKGGAFTGSIVHNRVGPEISRIGGLLIAIWQLLTCRW